MRRLHLERTIFWQSEDLPTQRITLPTYAIVTRVRRNVSSRMFAVRGARKRLVGND